MCGLVAVITKNRFGFTKNQVDIFDSLLFIDQLRGMDSTGVALVEKSGSLSLAKEASNATVFRTKPEYGQLLKTAFQTGSALFGHNRSATKGSITDENAHPFVVDDRITLMHNGTLWGDHKKLADTAVDSHAIAHVLHRHEDDVESALQEINGAYALIWHDFKNQTLNFVRNEQRPLHWIETEDGWYYASEANMLEWIISKYNLKINGDVNMLTPATLVTYTMTSGKWEVESKKIKLTKYVAPQHGYAPGWFRNGYEDTPDDGLDNVMPFQPRHTVAAIKTFEEELADKLLCHNTFVEYRQLEYQLKPRTYQAMTCCEYVEAGHGLGHWMYGSLEKFPEVLAKVYMAADVTEVELLAMCANNKRVLAEISDVKWELYTKQPPMHTKDMDGYVVARCGSLIEIQSKEELANA